MIVVDTNVIACLALPGPYLEHAQQLLRQEPEWAAPLLWRSEFRNVLALYMRRQQMTLAQAQRLQEEMEDLLRGQEFEVPSADVLHLVNESDCSAYDCEFVTLGSGLIKRDGRCRI